MVYNTISIFQKVVNIMKQCLNRINLLKQMMFDYEQICSLSERVFWAIIKWHVFPIIVFSVSICAINSCNIMLVFMYLFFLCRHRIHNQPKFYNNSPDYLLSFVYFKLLCHISAKIYSCHRLCSYLLYIWRICKCLSLISEKIQNQERKKQPYA